MLVLVGVGVGVGVGDVSVERENVGRVRVAGASCGGDGGGATMVVVVVMSAWIECAVEHIAYSTVVVTCCSSDTSALLRVVICAQLSRTCSNHLFVAILPDRLTLHAYTLASGETCKSI